MTRKNNMLVGDPTFDMLHSSSGSQRKKGKYFSSVEHDITQHQKNIQRDC